MSKRKQLLLTEVEEALGGKYKILRKIGSGGFGDVYLGEHAQLGRRVAIKVLLETYASQPDVVTRFQREARAAATLTHPNIIDILDVGESEDLYFFVMRFVDGETLSQKMQRERRFTQADAIHIMKQVADALDYAHQHNVIHRDIKPANIMLDEFGKPVLMDFGVARIQYEGGLTKTGTLMGTPHYLAPEQPLGKPVDGRSDIYSLGIMFYEMLAGEPPFQDDNSVTLIFKHINDQPVPLTKHVPDLNSELSAIVHKMIEKEPDARYQTAGEVADALEDLQTLFPPPSTLASRRSTPGLLRNTEKLVLLAKEHVQQNKWSEAISIYLTLKQRNPDEPAYSEELQQVGTRLKTTFFGQLEKDQFREAEKTLNELQRLLPSDESRTLKDTLERKKEEAEMQPTVAGRMELPVEAVEEFRMKFTPNALQAPPPVVTGSATQAIADAGSQSTKQGGALKILVPAIIIIVIALGVSGVFLFRFLQGENEARTDLPVEVPPVVAPVEPAVPPPPTTGRIRVTTQPEGATVFLSGQDRGTTPLELPDLPFGKYEVRVSLKGYEDQSDQVELNAGTVLRETEFQLLSKAPVIGALEIQSDPPKALIFIGKRNYGTTPKTIRDMGVGKYNVVLRKQGFQEFVAPVRVKEGESITVRATLIPIPEPEPVVPVPAAPVPPAVGELVELGPGVTAPKAVNKTAPKYSGKRWGTVRLRVLVSETGKVLETRVVQSAGADLDQAAVDAVRQWTYTPAKKMGVAVKVWSDVSITFARK